MLNLYEILQKIINESINNNDIINAIKNHNYVDINYNDKKSSATGRRLIQPYAYGITCAGNEAVRAFQVAGDSLRGEPKWKLFLLNRIASWNPRKQTFTVPPPMQGYNAPDYNSEGDGTMDRVLLQANFDGITDTLGAERAKTQFIKGAPKISTNNTKGPIPNASQQWKKNVFTSQPNSEKYSKYAKNIRDTENEFNRFDNDIWAKAEAEKEQQQQKNDIMLQNSAKKPEQTQEGPIAQPKNNEKDKKIKK